MLRPLGGPVADRERYFLPRAGQTNRLHGIEFPCWPRRTPWLECVVFEREMTFKEAEIGAFKFRNP